MNKIIFLFCFINIFSFSKEIILQNETYIQMYDYLIIIVSGMSENGEGLCSKALQNKRNQTFEIFQSLISKILEGKQLDVSDYSNGLKIMSILGNDCNPNKILAFMGKIFNLNINFIEEIGLNIMKNSKFIEGNIKNALDIGEINDKFKNIGKILTYILNFNVF